MRSLIYTFIAIISLTSCNDAPVVVTDSAGRMNDILLIIENDLWENAVGDTIRQVLAAPVDGLVREEPQFSLNQIDPDSFKGRLMKNRNYMKVEVSNKEAGVNVTKGLYANPQTGVVIRGKNAVGIIDQIVANADQIKTLFNDGEIVEKQRIMKKAALNVEQIKERFGIDLIAPRAYRYAAPNDKDFFWLRRNIKEGTMDVMIYEVAREAIPQDSNVVASITKVRDSVGTLKVPVDNGAFITEQAFSPYVNESQVDGKFAYETKGLWEVSGQFMSGPFLNYAIYNEKKDNWLIIEGYIFAPSAKQRNYLFELESILKSVKFIEEKK
ncbi:MAG: DUF4837 family protein [Nonlabens sp.]|uniref:DUF4837 family protein n=1 Tax=Nonlabens sp. TaxID=1888209 RepID=UPI003EF8BC82